jgi:hypothetical protein
MLSAVSVALTIGAHARTDKSLLMLSSVHPGGDSAAKGGLQSDGRPPGVVDVHPARAELTVPLFDSAAWMVRASLQPRSGKRVREIRGRRWAVFRSK